MDQHSNHVGKNELTGHYSIKRLGWVSAFSRKVLLGRHLLRAISAYPLSKKTPSNLTQRSSRELLLLFRVALTSQQSNLKNAFPLSASYAPDNRPTRFFLGYRRGWRAFVVNLEEKKHVEIGIGNLAFDFYWASELVDAPMLTKLNHLLDLETNRASKKVTLSTKKNGDENCIRIRNQPIWQGFKDERWKKKTKQFWDELLTTGHEWSFWRDWYQGFLDGKPLDWELQRRVALIPDEDWQKGPEHIARLIEEIKAAYLAEKLPLAEDLAFDQNTGTFHTIPREMSKPDLLSATLSQVEDALEDVMENCSNGINERSVECRKLTRTFRKYGNDPQRIEMDFTTVHAGLTRQIISGELPPSEENLALQSALEEGAKAVRATHPEVAENRRILQEQSLRELTPDEKATLEEALPVLQAISDEALAEEWAQDIPALTNDSLLPVPDTAPRLPGADEATRIFGRAARMALETKKSSNIIQRIDGHSGYKALRIVQVLEWLVQLGMRIFMYF